MTYEFVKCLWSAFLTAYVGGVNGAGGTRELL